MAHDDLTAVARALRRWLELNRSFGWDVPLRPPPRRSRVTASPRRPVGPSPAKSGVPRRRVLPPVLPASALQEGSSVEEIARREALLSTVRHEVAACTACGLCRGRTQTVFGVGNPCARLMFVGEAPGFEEDRQGEPFVGPAGRLLNDIIRAIRLRRQDVYIANAIKCRPPANRTPEPEEMAACLPYLRRQLDIIRPAVICALGAVAARGLLGTTASLGSLRGRFHDCQGVPLRVTYHPAYLLRYPEAKRKTWEDLQAVAERLGIDPRAP